MQLAGRWEMEIGDGETSRGIVLRSSLDLEYGDCKCIAWRNRKNALTGAVFVFKRYIPSADGESSTNQYIHGFTLDALVVT